jgi:hypothetical protein
MEEVPLWRGNHVGVRQLVDDFMKYLYLPRVKNTHVILDAIQDGVSRLTWANDSFAYADFYDAAADRYRGLEGGRRPVVQLNATSVVVKPGIAAEQMRKDSAPVPSITAGAATVGSFFAGEAPAPHPAHPAPAPQPAVMRRFHASATIDAARLSRDVDTIATSVVAHIAGLVGANVNITLEIDAQIPSGAPDNVVRTVTENCRTLKFNTAGFEES